MKRLPKLRSMLLVIMVCIALPGSLMASTMPMLINPDSPIGGIRPRNPIKKPPFGPQPVQPVLCQEGFFGCDLMRQALLTADYLKANENSDGYTPDPRPITPVSESVRLNIIPQVQGYLNLYTLTHKSEYAEAARTRMAYVVAQGAAALGNSPWDGNAGYVALDAYQRIGGDDFKQYGLAIADSCLTFTGKNGWGSDNILNWGYMCGMNLAKAYAITSDSKYLTGERRITKRNADRQNADGGFPHIPMALTDTNYTTWMMVEVLDIRKDDPQNPDADVTLLKAEPMLKNRVNADGSLNYTDGVNSFANNPGGYDTRGWTSNVSNLAYYMVQMGNDTLAQQLLTFLYSTEISGTPGTYPDKYAYFENDIWSTGGISVLRTSSIFNDLTAILLAKNAPTGSCATGAASSCVVSSDNCGLAFQELGVCWYSVPGVDRCIAGQSTQCVAPQQVTYPQGQCGETQCSVGIGNCIHICTPTGPQECIGQMCGECIEQSPYTACTDFCDPHGYPEVCMNGTLGEPMTTTTITPTSALFPMPRFSTIQSLTLDE